MSAEQPVNPLSTVYMAAAGRGWDRDQHRAAGNAPGAAGAERERAAILAAHADLVALEDAARELAEAYRERFATTGRRLFGPLDEEVKRLEAALARFPRP